MPLRKPQAGDQHWTNCQTCGPQSATYRQVGTVPLADGAALVHDVLGAVCDTCNTVVSLPLDLPPLEIVEAAPSSLALQTTQHPVPTQLTASAAQHLRRLQLAGLPRIGTSPARDLPHLRRMVEDIALEVGELLQAPLEAGDSKTWRTQHLLDDVLDVLEAVHCLQTGKALSGSTERASLLAADRKVKQVLVVRKDLNMPRGKQCAQASHGAVNALAKGPGAHIVQTTTGAELRIPLDVETQAWLETDYRKVVLAVQSEEELHALHAKAIASGLRCHLVQDNGLTMFDGVKTYTALALGPHSDETFEGLTSHLKPL